MGNLSKVYTNILKRYPLFTQCVQTGALMGLGDCIAQIAVERKSFKDYSPLRTAQFSVVGFGMVGPTLTKWYAFLSRTFGHSGKSAVLKKLACDQLLFTPVYVVAILSTLGFVQQIPFKDTYANIRADYGDIIINNYKVWPAAQLINFYFMPLHYQVLFAQCIALAWNSYISWKTQKHHDLVRVAIDQAPDPPPLPPPLPPLPPLPKP